MSIANRIEAIAAAEPGQARMLLGQEAECAREAVSRAANAATVADIDKSTALLAHVTEAVTALRAKLPE